MSGRISRRRFLGASAAMVAGPAIMARGTTDGPDRAEPSNRIVMGAVGLGWQGPANLRQFLANSEVQVVAVCDVDQNHLMQTKRMVDNAYGNTDCATYNNFEEMYARGDLDAVSIALPDHWHAIPVIAAADAGLDIYGEKPLSHKLAEGRAMCEAVARNNRIWQTGSWQRSVDNFRHAAELVRNGRIGKVNYIEVGLGRGHTDYAETVDQTEFGPHPPELDYDRWLGPAPEAPYCPARVHKNWRWIMDYGGGRIMDWVGHHLDIAHWGMGLDLTGPVTVQGTAVIPSGQLWDAPTEYDCTCTYASGLEVKINSEFRGGTRWVGEYGSIYVSRRRTEAEPSEVLEEVIGDDEIRLYHSRDHYKNFIDCVKSREETITPCEVAHRSASVGHLCLIGIYTGRKITWNPDNETIIDDPGASEMLSPNYRAPWELPA